MHRPDIDSYEDDRLIAEANELLTRELPQVQKNKLATCLTSRQVVSLVSPQAMLKNRWQQMGFDNYIRTGTCRSPSLDTRRFTQKRCHRAKI
jgi:hypothetical protein